MLPIDDLIQEANDLINAEEYGKALPILKQILEKDPEDTEILYLSAMANIELEKYEDAEKILETLLKIDAENIDALLQLGYLKHQNGEINQSKEFFYKIIEIDPMNADAYQMLGLMAMDDGDYKSAVDYLDASFANEEDYDVYLNIVESYLEMEKLEKAFEMLEKLDTEKLNQDSYETYDNLRTDYFLAKTIESWSGTKKDENGDEVYFPINIEELEDGEHFVEMAKIQESKDKDTIERIKLFEEVLQTNREKLTVISQEPVKSQEESSNENYFTLSDKDQKAWSLLEEIFDHWTEMEVKNGHEYRWPKTIEEIDASNKIFNEIKKLRPKDKAVKNRLKELEKVVKKAKSWVPNYTRIFLRSLAFSVLAVVILVFAFSRDNYKAPKFSYDKADFVVRSRTNLLYFNKMAYETGDKKYSIPLPLGTQLIPIAQWGSKTLQVETESGNRGFVELQRLRGVENVVVDTDYPLFSDMEMKNPIDSLYKDQNVRILSLSKEITKRYNTYRMAKIRTEKGQTGYFPFYLLETTFQNSLPELSMTFEFPTTEKNIKNNIVGSNLSDIEKKYGPARSILNVATKKVAFFDQHNFVKDGKRYYGIFLQLDKNNKVTNYEYYKSSRLHLYDRLPLAGTLRKMEPFSLLKLGFYKGKKLSFKWLDNFRNKNGFARMIGDIFYFILMLPLILLFFSFPRLIMNPFMVLIGNWRALQKGLVLKINFMIYAFGTYFFFIWMALLMDSTIVPLIFMVIAFRIWWFFYDRNIRLNRCPQCNTMNVGLDKGRTFTGETYKEGYGTYNKYIGTTETDTQIIHNYEKRTYFTRKVFKHFLHSRECVRCGYDWNVAETETSEGTKFN